MMLHAVSWKSSLRCYTFKCRCEPKNDTWRGEMKPGIKMIDCWFFVAGPGVWKRQGLFQKSTFSFTMSETLVCNWSCCMMSLRLSCQSWCLTSLLWHHQRDETECDKNHLRWQKPYLALYSPQVFSSAHVLPEITEKKRCLSGCCNQPPGGVQEETRKTGWAFPWN